MRLHVLSPSLISPHPLPSKTSRHIFSSPLPLFHLCPVHRPAFASFPSSRRLHVLVIARMNAVSASLFLKQCTLSLVAAQWADQEEEEGGKEQESTPFICACHRGKRPSAIPSHYEAETQLPVLSALTVNKYPPNVEVVTKEDTISTW